MKEAVNYDFFFLGTNLLQLLNIDMCRCCIAGVSCTKLLIMEVQVIDFQAPWFLTEEQYGCGHWRVGSNVHTSKCKSGRTLDSIFFRENIPGFYFTI